MIFSVTMDGHPAPRDEDYDDGDDTDDTDDTGNYNNENILTFESMNK